LLSKKYALDASMEYGPQIQKAVNYFPSALHLHQWLGHNEYEEVIAPNEEKLNSLISEQLAQFQEPLVSVALEFEVHIP
jgi:hypothetical protein